MADHVGDEPEAVQRNRHIVFAEFGDGVAATYVMAAEHGNRVVTVDAGHAPIGPHDGLVTNQSGVVVVALAADCVPFVLIDTENHVVGAAHSGWRGVVSNVAASTFNAMANLGAKPASTKALLGPAICQNCYPVEHGRAVEFTGVAPNHVKEVDGIEFLDVRGAVAMQLANIGVQTTLVGGCTYEDQTLFSYRRQQTTGRHGAAVMLT